MTGPDVKHAQLVWFRSGSGHFLDQMTSQGRSRTPIHASTLDDALRALAREGWKEAHRTGDSEGILVTLRRTEKPAPAPAAPGPAPAFIPRSPAPNRAAPVTPYSKDRMQEGVEYAALYWNRRSGSYSIDYYDHRGSRRESGGLSDLNGARAHLAAQGWTMTFTTGDGEGVISYFERPAPG